MKWILVTTASALLLWAAIADARPAMVASGAQMAPGLAEAAQFKNQGHGEGFKKRGWVKPKSSTECYRRCIAAGKRETPCARRCKNPSAKSINHRDR